MLNALREQRYVFLGSPPFAKRHSSIISLRVKGCEEVDAIPLVVSDECLSAILTASLDPSSHHP